MNNEMYVKLILISTFVFSISVIYCKTRDKTILCYHLCLQIACHEDIVLMAILKNHTLLKSSQMTLKTFFILVGVGQILKANELLCRDGDR